MRHASSSVVCGPRTHPNRRKSFLSQVRTAFGRRGKHDLLLSFFNGLTMSKNVVIDIFAFFGLSVRFRSFGIYSPLSGFVFFKFLLLFKQSTFLFDVLWRFMTVHSTESKPPSHLPPHSLPLAVALGGPVG